MSESEITPIPVHTSESATESAAESSDIQTQFTSTWTTTKSDGSFVTESGVISQSGTSLPLLPHSHHYTHHQTLPLSLFPLGPPLTLMVLLPLRLELLVNPEHR